MKRTFWMFTIGALSAAWLLQAVVRSSRTAEDAMTRESLLATFADDMGAVVLEWPAEDPRPPADRQLALFDFVYQTYQSSAWIPQSLFDRNLVTQAIVGDVETIVGEQVGLAVWRGNRRVELSSHAMRGHRALSRAGSVAGVAGFRLWNTRR